MINKPQRAMRLPPATVASVLTEDEVELRLARYEGGERGPVVLAAGYAMSANVFRLDTMPTSLAEYLCAGGYDVWLLSWRGSPDVAASTSRFTLDDVARYDWPAAIATVRQYTGAERVDCVVHCIGSQTLLMSLVRGYLGTAVRSAACLQVGLYYDMPALRRFLSRMRVPQLINATGMRYLDASATVHNGTWYRALDTLLKAYPVSAKERCRNRTCRRSAFMWGELIDHANISTATHERMGTLLGNASILPFTQMARSTLAGHVIAADGADVYLDGLDGLRIPITFIHGGDNATVLPGSTLSTFDTLCRRNGATLYRHHLVPGYGHMDCLIGDDADRDVYPLIGEHLERVRASGHAHATS